MDAKVLVVGQTPPPYGGQAMMIARLVNADFKRVKIVHIRMNFSDSFKSVGKPSLSKIFHLPILIIRIWRARIMENVKVLYFPPAGPNLNPVLRDIIILLSVRIFFRKTIFHFRASGVSELVRKAFFPIRMLAKLAYNKPDVAIQLSMLNPADGAYFRARRIVEIKNGLEDAALPFVPIHRAADKVVRILTVGVIKESKGIFVILDAVKSLKDKSLRFEFACVGDFDSAELEKKVKNRVHELNIDDRVVFPGIRLGAEKWTEYEAADIFCFPTFFESESFGNVAVEAMMFELPVVATRWRGVQDIVIDGTTGFLVPIRDSTALAAKIEILMSDYSLRQRMGVKGRERFLSEFQLATHLNNMENLFLELTK